MIDSAAAMPEEQELDHGVAIDDYDQTAAIGSDLGRDLESATGTPSVSFKTV